MIFFLLEHSETPPQRIDSFLNQVAPLHPSSTAGAANMALNIASIRDTKWLTLEVCRQFQRGTCSRSDEECKFAHPPKSCQVENGRVIACFDSLKVRTFKYNWLLLCSVGIFMNFTLSSTFVLFFTQQYRIQIDKKMCTYLDLRLICCHECLAYR